MVVVVVVVVDVVCCRGCSGESVFIKNVLESGERLIVSPLKVALPGMKVDVHEVDADVSSDSQTEAGG